jgi:hypothetical protein
MPLGAVHPNSFRPIAAIAVIRRLRQHRRMKARLPVIIAVAILAFAAGWFVRGLNPELSCKTRGGFYSETTRTCIFAEPSASSVNEAQEAAKQESSASQSAAVPFSSASINDAAYHLKVHRDGTFSWNGQVVNEVTLHDYLRKFSEMPEGAGSLSLEFEPGSPTKLKELLRRDITDSGLCRQGRCVEMRWGTPTRVVN